LPNHLGKCRDPHGHSYRVTINVEGKVDKRPGEPTEGMVLDFDTIRVAWEEHLKPILDHKDLNEQFVFVTTAENIAAWILIAFRDRGINAHSVDLWETESASVHVTYSDVWDDESMFRALTAAAMAGGEVR
jgi:6-pyruvoyltetrahydropterin/6-carboxytetrahydropterin synthase